MKLYRPSNGIGNEFLDAYVIGYTHGCNGEDPNPVSDMKESDVEYWKGYWKGADEFQAMQQLYMDCGLSPRKNIMKPWQRSLK